ncbi:lipoyl(octanoyl) transferase LipB [Salinibius halmophilus]|uniref:lipoyl(octanoyl) transferase LipB n=1 Tax=Salinibius halmophilus TaxID=1853216 RepID=UPI000E66AA8A|nr:lipoyl(octanoyl) transferase LipB [Salinibius halmophilus]
MQPLIVRHLGRQPYQATYDKMRAFTDERGPHTPDEIWLLDHEPVFTQGQAGKAEHVLVPGDIPVVQTDRGGQVTYHGPGQMIAYPLIDVKRSKLGVRELVTAIETSVVTLMQGYNVEAYAKPDAPGVYVQHNGVEHKLASLGLRIRKGRSYHGLGLNVDADLSPFNRINPCGYAGMPMTRMIDLAEVDPKDVPGRWLDAFIKATGREFQVQVGAPHGEA